jgi:SAM-dependent methyltransferase
MSANHFSLMARVYHARGLAWPGESDFYLDLAAQAIAKGTPVLEIACGTGRIATRLALAGADVTGFDISPEMLEVARLNNAGVTNIRFLEADMRSFHLALDEQQKVIASDSPVTEHPVTFGLIISPGHSFQHLCTIPDQLDCLACLRKHLAPGGLLVLHIDHQDLSWLGKLGGVFEPGEEVIDPFSGHLVRTRRAWTYEPSTQTASAVTRWEEMGLASQLLDQWETGPARFHCFFRFEMEHLLHRAGFQIEALYGDFRRGDLTDNSSEMIWLVKT